MRSLLLIVVFGASVAPLPGQSLVLSNLGASPSEAQGWVWEAFADTVMGGSSELSPPIVLDLDEGKALLLAGRVVTRGGGFIQVRLKYDARSFDASGYSGVEIDLSSPNEGSYFIFLRTRDSLFPWSYYGAPVRPTDRRTTIRIPWSSFSAQSTLRTTLRPDRLTSIAMTAAFEDFNALLHIYRVGLYR
ncbi:MAG: hypothetical protein EA403_00900 [Spirochaetaceae bacterium]|nr:MAG: hypothetical protein EA403_00900 [Spirochaetaceae bacterium]